MDTTPAPQAEPTPPAEPVLEQQPPPSIDIPDPQPAPESADTEAVEQLSPEEIPSAEPVPEPLEDPIEPEDPPAEETIEPLTPELPEGDEDPVFTEPGEADPSTESNPATRSLDLDSAIQDFGRVLDRARANAPAPDRGSGPARNVYVPDSADMSTTGYGMGNLTFETADFDWSDYARAVYTQIWRAWHNRLLRMTNEFEKWAYVNREPTLRHAMRVRFVIERSGQVTGIMVENPSGCGPLDNSATQALAEVILPPLPEAFPKQREVVHAVFLASGEIRYMKPALTQMKALNYF